MYKPLRSRTPISRRDTILLFLTHSQVKYFLKFSQNFTVFTSKVTSKDTGELFGELLFQNTLKMALTFQKIVVFLSCCFHLSFPILFSFSLLFLSWWFPIALCSILIRKSHESQGLKYQLQSQCALTAHASMAILNVRKEKKTIIQLIDWCTNEQKAAFSHHWINTTAGGGKKTTLACFYRGLQTPATFLLSCSCTPPYILKDDLLSM